MEDNIIIRVENLKKWFPVRRSFIDTLMGRPQKFIKAVDGISFDIRKAEIFCLAGESGCGKTTTGKVIHRLLRATSGRVLFKGVDIMSLEGEKLKGYRRKAAIIFQDPYESLNPRMTALDIISEPLVVHKLVHTEDEKIEAVSKALEDVALKPPEDFIFRFPHELSGGQRQRVSIARALVTNPEFIVADEPVSMLDMSIRAEILNLLLSLRDKYNLSFLFITHDLAVAKYICDRIAIMYLGKIVEMGDAEEVIDNPLHPYTKALISAVPVPDPRIKIGEIPIKGEVPSPINIPPGCRFHPRCVVCEKNEKLASLCKSKEPKMVEVKKGHFVACHLYS